MDILKTLQALNACHGPSGDEKGVAEVIARLAEPFADEIKTDTMGNLIVHKKGPGPRILFAAHMDSIGCIVTHIEKEGFLRFGKVGG
ncbi:MAG: M42 family peptidase, partial [Clostridia bacterium]|nr:M42 family peptidase [Clostridia bacterium]